MMAYKGFHTGLTCLGQYQFYKHKWNITDQANCRKNGFHCAENPLDCLVYYGNVDSSVYYVVDARGDIHEEEGDSKISCTKLCLVRELSLMELLLEGIAYMIKYPERKWSNIVKKDFGETTKQYAVIRGRNPKGKGVYGTILVLIQEDLSGHISDVAILVIDRKRYSENVWYDFYGKEIQDTN